MQRGPTALARRASVVTRSVLSRSANALEWKLQHPRPAGPFARSRGTLGTQAPLADKAAQGGDDLHTKDRRHFEHCPTAKLGSGQSPGQADATHALTHTDASTTVTRCRRSVRFAVGPNDVGDRLG